MSNLFLGPFNSLYSGYIEYNQRKEIHTVISNPGTKTAKLAIQNVETNLLAAKEAYDTVKAQKQKYDNAVNLVRDGKKIEGYLKIFSAIEASTGPTSVNNQVNSRLTQLHNIQLSRLDVSILDKQDPITKKTLRDTLNEFLDTSPLTSDQPSTEEASEKDPLIKKIKNSLPENKRESIEKFNSLVAALEAACFGFAARYGLFSLDYNPADSTHKINNTHLTPLEKYSLMAIYEEAVCFLQKITPHYYKREFHIVPSSIDTTKKITTVAQDALVSNSPIHGEQHAPLISTPSKARLIPTFAPYHMTPPALPMPPQTQSFSSTLNSSLDVTNSIAQKNSIDFENRIHAYLQNSGVIYKIDEKTNAPYCQEFEDLKKLILFYKQQNKLMNHERLPLVGGDSYIHEQTEARITLSLYDYHIIMKMMVDQDQYGPLITNLIQSHKELLSDLEYDKNGTIKPKSGAKPPAFDPWMTNFVKLVLRNRIPLNLFVLFPDLTQALEKSFIGKRIGGAIGVEENPVLNSDECPILLTGEELFIRCRKDDSKTKHAYKVEFLINGKWFDITTAQNREESVKDLLEKDTGATLSKDITFNGVLKQFFVRSVGWHHLDMIHGTGLQIYHKHYQIVSEVKDTDKQPDGALKATLRSRFKPFVINKDAQVFEKNNYLFTRTREKAAEDAQVGGAHEGDIINRDHFTAQITSYEDLQQQYPDYDLSRLKDGEFAVFYSANRENGLSNAKTHAFLKLILPEGDNKYRLINVGYFADNDLATPAQIFAYLGKTERGALHSDEGHYMLHRDRIGMGIVMNQANFTKTCNYIQKVLNKTRQDRLSFQPFGVNCAHRLTKIFRNTVADDFQTTLTTSLRDAYKAKLKPVTIFDKLWKVFSKYILFTTDAHREKAFRKSLRKAVEYDDMNKINAYLSDLLPHIDADTGRALFKQTAQFLAEIHLNHQSKFKDNAAVNAVTGSAKFEALLDADIAEASRDIEGSGTDEKHFLLAPFKQLTSDHNDAFFKTISTNLENYENLVNKQMSKDALDKEIENLVSKNKKTPKAVLDKKIENLVYQYKQTAKDALDKEIKNLLKEFIIQGLKTSSPYGMPLSEADHGPLNVIFSALRVIPTESLRNFVFAVLAFFLLAAGRWRNIDKCDENGVCTGKTKSKSFSSDLMRANRFKLPAQIFNNIRKNDEFIVKEAVLCKKMQILQDKVAELSQPSETTS